MCLLCKIYFYSYNNEIIRESRLSWGRLTLHNKLKRSGSLAFKQFVEISKLSVVNVRPRGANKSETHGRTHENKNR